MTRAVSGMATSQNRSSRRVSRRSGRGGEYSDASAGNVSVRPTAGSGIPAIPPLVAFNDVLAAQEMTGPTQESRRGEGCPLDDLHQLPLGMVEGWVSEGTLRRLAGLVDRLAPRADPSGSRCRARRDRVQGCRRAGQADPRAGVTAGRRVVTGRPATPAGEAIREVGTQWAKLGAVL